MSKRTIKLAAAVSVAGALALGGGAWAIAGGGDGNVTGPDADKAKAAALAHLGGGTANAVERDNEKGAVWEVEVTKDGKTVDVRLDDTFGVVAVDGDADGTEDETGENEDGSESEND